MEKKVSSNTACQADLLVDLIDRAARRADDVLRLPSGILIAKRVEDDGLSRIERLELSPQADDQLLALAFRRAGRLDGTDLREDLIQVFESGLSSFTVEAHRSEEHTSELQSLMRISYAVFCLTKKKYTTTT